MMISSIMRQTNRRRIYQYIYDSREAVTKQEIANALSFSLSSVSNTLDGLTEDGLVTCEEPSPGKRKSHAYALAPRAHFAVGISIRSDRVSIAAMDMRMEELAFRELELPFCHFDSYYQEIARELEELLDGAGLDRGRLLGVGITLPGIIDQREGVLVMAPSLDVWDVPLEEIYRHFSRYPAFVENDANASGYIEYWLDEDRRSMVYLTLGRGVGGAIVLGDKQYMGNSGRSGEFGHLCIVPNGRPCLCGRRGCVEAYCSVSRLSDDYGITLEEFFARLEAGEAEFAALWEEYEDHLADALAVIRLSFDCDIVLGGALATYLEPYLPELGWKLGEKTLFDSGGSSLRLGRFGPHSACAGTALRFVDEFINSF